MKTARENPITGQVFGECAENGLGYGKLCSLSQFLKIL